MNKKMKKSLLLPLAFAMLAASCGTSEVKTSSSVAVDDYAVTWVTPTGAPTLAFYDQGDNDKWPVEQKAREFDEKGNTIRSAGQLRSGDRITLRLSDGRARCLVDDVRRSTT